MKQNLKNSEKRDAILEVLKNTKTHPTADWIYDKIRTTYPQIGIATVYRNLKILLEQKQIMKIEVGDGIDHYDAGVNIPHDHTYCMKCGAIGDINPIPVGSLEELAKDEFSVSSYSLIIYGKCKKCMQEETLE